MLTVTNNPDTGYVYLEQADRVIAILPEDIGEVVSRLMVAAILVQSGVQFPLDSTKQKKVN